MRQKESEVNHSIEREPEPTIEKSPAAPESQEWNRRRLVTVVFGSREEYESFTEHVFRDLGGRGLELTNVPIDNTVRVRGWLFEQTRGSFDVRPVTKEDVAQARERLKGRKAWDPANLKNFPNLFNPKESR